METTHNLELDECTTLKDVIYYVEEEYYCQQDIIDLWKENKQLTEKLSNAEALKEESFRQEDRLLQENKDLKRKRLTTFNNEDCWVFSDNEPNYLRTLVCPVILSPVYLQTVQELLWESCMWLQLTLDEDEPIWDSEQADSARLCLHSSKELLKGFCIENDGGYR